MKSVILGSTALLTSLILPALVSAEDYVIDVPVATTNGGNTLDGDDSITVLPGGEVTTLGLLQNALEAAGHNNTLTNEGNLATKGFGANGMAAGGDSNTLTNAGNVNTTGTASFGMFALGNNNILTNSGTGAIFTSGGGSSGMHMIGSGNTLANDGSIKTSFAEAHGMYASGDNNTLTNSGTGAIFTSGGHFALGLYALGNNNTLTNNGTVTTSGLDAYGLVALGSGNTLTNSGTVTTGGQAAFGLHALGSGNTLTNSGTVTTSGSLALGLYALGNNNTLTNNGTVTTSGLDAYGLYADGNNNTLTNSGTVISEQSYSIYTTGANATVNLLEGSVLQGDVMFNDNVSATLNFGTGLNAMVAVDSLLPGTVTAPNNAYVEWDNVYYVVDSTGFVAADRTAGNVGGMALDALAGHLSDGGAPVAGKGLMGDGQGWAQVFGGYRSHNGDDSAADYDGYSFGAMAGKDLDGGHGFFVGGAHSRDKSDSSFDNTSNTVFAGYYTSYDIGTVAVDASLTFGVAQNDSERTVANNMVPGGLETATADYNSYFLMPAATFKGDWAVANGTLTPSLRLRYAAVHQEGYTETGLTSGNMTVDSRTSHLLEARLQLERGLADRQTAGGTLMSDLHFGVDGQYLKGDDVSSTLAGQSLVFTPDEDNVAGRAFVGLDMKHVSGDGSRALRGGVELGHSNTGTTDLSATFRWNVSF